MEHLLFLSPQKRIKKSLKMWMELPASLTITFPKFYLWFKFHKPITSIYTVWEDISPYIKINNEIQETTSIIAIQDADKESYFCYVSFCIRYFYYVIRKARNFNKKKAIHDYDKVKFLFSHFFVVPQKVLWRPRPS